MKTKALIIVKKGMIEAVHTNDENFTYSIIDLDLINPESIDYEPDLIGDVEKSAEEIIEQNSQLIGFQVLIKKTNKYPDEFYSFEVLTKEAKDKWLKLQSNPNEFKVIKIFSNTIENPTIITENNSFYFND